MKVPLPDLGKQDLPSDELSLFLPIAYAYHAGLAVKGP
jgi:hypothetical protein